MTFFQMTPIQLFLIFVVCVCILFMDKIGNIVPADFFCLFAFWHYEYTWISRFFGCLVILNFAASRTVSDQFLKKFFIFLIFPDFLFIFYIWKKIVHFQFYLVFLLHLIVYKLEVNISAIADVLAVFNALRKISCKSLPKETILFWQILILILFQIILKLSFNHA